jgi:ATP-binding cassette subfamily B protein
MTTADTPAPAGLWGQLTTLASQMRRVLPIIARRHKVMLVLAMAVMMLNSALATAVPVLFGALVNGLTEALKEGAGTAPLLGVAELYLGLIGGVYLLRELLVVGQKYLVENACTRIERDMTVVVVSHLFKADLGAVGRERAGSLQDRVSRSVEGLVSFLTLGFTEFLPGLMAIATALAWVLFVDGRVGLVLCGVIPLYGLLALRQLTVQRASRREIIDSKQGLDAAVLERLGGLEYIRAAHTYHREVDRVEAAAEEQRKRKIRYYLSMARFDCLKALNEGFFHLLVLVLAIVLVARHSAFLLSDKGIEPGDVVMFSMLFYRVVNPMRALSATLQGAQECSLRVEDLLRLLAEPMDASFTPALTRNLSMMARVAQLYWRDLPAQVSAREPSLARGAPAIAVSDLFVEYPVEGGPPRRVLHGVSLRVEHGQMIGVAGPAGSGKSTWLKVLLRLTHPAAGEVFVGGVPLDGLSREAIGRLFGYVSQTPYLFAGTIEENIVYGSEGATPEAVRLAAALASIHDEIMAMPNGYQTAVAERGQNLSGGQRQRIALARVFLENPPILILDEATSALDNINERAVQEAVARSRADRTTVVVAHRLSTLRDADRILVFDQGRIVESGGFEELERGNGLFSRLVRSTGDVRLAS